MGRDDLGLPVCSPLGMGATSIAYASKAACRSAQADSGQGALTKTRSHPRPSPKKAHPFRSGWLPLP